MATDFAVIGGGTAGLTAAVAAAEKGAKVLVLEKMATTGGTGSMGMGPFAVESHLQKKAGINLTRDQIFKMFMEYTHWRVDARLVRDYIDKSGDTIKWLEDMGVEWFEVEEQVPGEPATHHNVKYPGGGTGGMAAGAMMKVLTERTRELGGEVLLQTKVKKILKENGKVTGLIAEDRDGEEIQVKAEAVLVATGGFGDNEAMIKKYTGHEFGKTIYSMRIPGMDGDGLRLAWEAGAAPTEMTMQLIYSLVPPFAGRGGTREELAAFRQPNLVVNLDGLRITNEEIVGNTTYMGNAVNRQKNHCAFVIFDEDTKKYYEQNGLQFGIPEELEDLDKNIELAWKEGCDSIWVTDSLEDLAAKTGINPEGLKKTAAEYNQACEKGRDDIFNKNPEYLRPIKQPRFYCAKYVPSAYGSLGGIRVNYKLEVVDKNYDVIPGFYAAGTDANSICGDSYVYILPGTTMGFAVNSGRLAGEYAADYVQGK